MVVVQEAAQGIAVQARDIPAGEAALYQLLVATVVAMTQKGYAVSTAVQEAGNCLGGTLQAPAHALLDVIA